MDLDFELILTIAVIITGLGYLIDLFIYEPKRREKGTTHVPLVLEYSRSFAPILLVVLVLRSFLAEPFRIPSGSDKPTLLVGDFILVNKFAYGLRLPVLRDKILSNRDPKTGDIIVHRYPVNPSQYFIKRVIGMPGDHISYINKVLYINGVAAPQTSLGTAMDADESGNTTWPVEVREEDLAGVKHKIYVNPSDPAQDFTAVVPVGQYFVMGDNRDNSNDSRYWGFVPEHNLVGKAFAIWFSWNGDEHKVRWSRIGELIH